MREEERKPGISGWLLECALVGELSPEDRRRLEDELAGNPALAEEMARRLAENDAILARIPPEKAAKEILRRHEAGREAAARCAEGPDFPARARAPAGDSLLDRLKSRFRLPMLIPAAGLALLAFLVVPRIGDREAGDGIRFKGGAPALFIYRKTDVGTEQVRSGEVGKAGERLQLMLQASAGAYAAVISLDGRGRITRIWPSQGEHPAVVPGSEKFSLPQSYRLDDAPAFERFFLVVSDRRFKLQEAVRAVEALAGKGIRACCEDVELGPGFGHSSFLLIKQGGA